MTLGRLLNYSEPFLFVYLPREIEMHFNNRTVNIKWENKYVKYLLLGLTYNTCSVNISSCHCHGMHSTKNKVNTIEFVLCGRTPSGQLTEWQVKLPLWTWQDLAALPSRCIEPMLTTMLKPHWLSLNWNILGSCFHQILADTFFLALPRTSLSP